MMHANSIYPLTPIFCSSQMNMMKPKQKLSFKTEMHMIPAPNNIDWLLP